MCRIIRAVFFVSILSCVLAEINQELKTCMRTSEANTTRTALNNCLSDTVDRHLHPSNVSLPGKCQNAADVGEKLDTYIKLPNDVCNIKITLNTTIIKSLIDFSLKNQTFKEFYKTIDCVKKFESNISNDCVKNKVGYFNITKEKKHLSWGVRTNVYYSENTCIKSKNVKDCVEARLSSCDQPARAYVASLFDHVRAFGNCDQYNKTDLLPPVHKPSSTWFTTPVKITVGVGAFVVGVAIIIVVVFKYRNK